VRIGSVEGEEFDEGFIGMITCPVHVVGTVVEGVFGVGETIFIQQGCIDGIGSSQYIITIAPELIRSNLAVGRGFKQVLLAAVRAVKRRNPLF